MDAVRHGKARRIYLRLEVDAGRLMLVIEDDGVGITPQRRRKPGLGWAPCSTEPA